MPQRPKLQHINSTGAGLAACVAVAFGVLEWLFPEVPQPPSGLEGMATVAVSFLFSQFFRL